MRLTIDILLADDQEHFRRALKRALPECAVTEATNADELIAEAKRRPYSLILTDNSMDDGHGDSGLYAIGEIRRFDAETPIILQSSYVSEELRRSALAAGATDVRAKSGGLQELRTMIATYVRGA